MFFDFRSAHGHRGTLRIYLVIQFPRPLAIITGHGARTSRAPPSFLPFRRTAQVILRDHFFSSCFLPVNPLLVVLSLPRPSLTFTSTGIADFLLGPLSLSRPPLRFRSFCSWLLSSFTVPARLFLRLLAVCLF